MRLCSEWPPFLKGLVTDTARSHRVRNVLWLGPWTAWKRKWTQLQHSPCSLCPTAHVMWPPLLFSLPLVPHHGRPHPLRLRQKKPFSEVVGYSVSTTKVTRGSKQSFLFPVSSNCYFVPLQVESKCYVISMQFSIGPHLVSCMWAYEYWTHENLK